MIIGIDASRAITSQRTGTEAYAYYLIQALLPLATQQGHRVYLYFNQAPPTNLWPTYEGVQWIHIPFRRLWTHVRLAQTLQQQPPDVFFTPAHVIPFTYRGCSVATVHDLGYHYFPQTHPWAQRLYLRWSTGYNGRVSRRVLADSQATKADLVRFYGLPPSKIDVVYPGIDPTLKPISNMRQQKAIQSKYGLTPPYLLYLGTLQPRKNLVRLVQAYAASQVSCQLVLAGKKGWLTQPILKTIAELPPLIADKVILPGYIDEADKATLISSAIGLLYPSLYEGFGFPVLEAQACGTAVLCANSSSLPEIVGDSAFLVDPLATKQLTVAIRRLVAESSWRQTLIERGLANVKRFTWQETAVHVLKTLQQATE